MNKPIIIYLLLFTLLLACKPAQKESNHKTENKVNVPVFSPDSARSYVQAQVDFGPRVPNTTAHKACAGYMAAKLKQFGATVTEQHAILTAFDGTKLQAVNIIGSFQPEKKNRILLFAHWDSRPWADADPDQKNQKSPVTGANDGASGVGVLLEIARILGTNPTGAGVDIILFDAEDYGAPQHAVGNTENSWCLGSQYWAKNPHQKDYVAQYGILLDMVGAPGATFYKEQISTHFASHIINKVWTQAQALGFDSYFINKVGGAITDDHLYVNQILGIPCIDIIQHDPNTASGFGSYWHTVSDTMDQIDLGTLNAVGTTLLHVIYNEK